MSWWGIRACARSAVLALLAGLLVGCATSLQAPVLIETGRLVYPAAAKAQGIQGEVVVQYDVLVDGSVATVRIVRAEPPGVFEQAALGLVRSFRFRPARQGGHTVPSIAQTSTVRFKLDDGAYEGY